MARHQLMGERPALRIFAGVADVPADPFDPVRDLLDLIDATRTAQRLASLAPGDNACRTVARELEAQLDERCRDLSAQLATTSRPSGGEGGAA